MSFKIGNPGCPCCVSVPACLNCQTCAPPSCIMISFDYPSVTLSNGTVTDCQISTAHVNLSLASNKCSWTGSFVSNPLALFYVSGPYASDPQGWWNSGRPSRYFVTGWWTDCSISVSCTAGGFTSSSSTQYLEYSITWNHGTNSYIFDERPYGRLLKISCSPFSFGNRIFWGADGGTSANYGGGTVVKSGSTCICPTSSQLYMYFNYLAKNVSLAPCP
jgi:hypothetical protein